MLLVLQVFKHKSKYWTNDNVDLMVEQDKKNPNKLRISLNSIVLILCDHKRLCWILIVETFHSGPQW